MVVQKGDEQNLELFIITLNNSKFIAQLIERIFYSTIILIIIIICLYFITPLLFKAVCL